MAKIKKTKTGWSVSGSFEECLAQKKKQLEQLNRETDYIMKLFEEVKRRYDSHFAQIVDCEHFIKVVTEKIEEKKNEVQ